MKQSNLKHSFDEVTLCEEKKREMLEQLKAPRARKSRDHFFRPAMAMALTAVMLGGIYLGTQYLKHPRQSIGPLTTDTTRGNGRSLPGLSIFHDTLIRLEEDTSYPISPEAWQRISEILSKAEYNPEINAITTDLRENDLHLTSQDASYYLIREFTEIYYRDDGHIEAWYLSEDDGFLLEKELRLVMEQSSAIDDPEGTYRLTQWLERQPDILQHLVDSKNYAIPLELWQDIAAILQKAHSEPDINAVTDDLREHDMNLMGTFEEYLFLRDYREIYLSGPGFFSAYSLDKESSAALKNILAEVMTEEHLTEDPASPKDPLVPEDPADDLTTIPVLDMIHVRLSHPMADTEYRVSPDEWKFLREILLRASHEPDWNAVTEELRESDLYLFNSSLEYLFLRDYHEVYLMGTDRLVGYSIAEEDQPSLKNIMETIMTPDNILVQGERPSPGDLPFIYLYGDSTGDSWQITGDDLGALTEILGHAEYVETLGMLELIEAKAGLKVEILTSESPELILTSVSGSGDIFIQTDIALSADTKRNYHYRLSPEKTTEFLDLIREIRSRAPMDRP